MKELQERFPGVEWHEGIDMPALWVPAEQMLEVMTALKEEYGFNFLADLTGVDLPEKDQLVLVYHLMAVPEGREVRIKVATPRRKPEVPSLVALWPAAEVQERETYDLLGVVFVGHPRLKRILCPEDFEGHPLRKDFRLPKEEGGMEGEA
ncbi:MAG: NADH-quinone oxidoreductase subunit C [Moorellaceae bacterium]